MPDVLKAKCPGCKRELRIPAEWINQAFRCKFCRTVVQPKQAKIAGKGNGPALSGPAVTPAKSAPPPDAGLPFADNEDAPLVRVAAHYRRSSHGRWLAFAIILVLLGGGAGLAYYFWTPLVQLGVSVRERVVQETKSAEVKPPIAEPSLPGGGIFPRRALAICVNNYLYANPVAYGTEENDVGLLLDRLGKVLHMDPSQIVELSDAAKARQSSPAAGKKGKVPAKAGKAKAGPKTESPARPPLKPVIEKTVTEFLDTCRPQDRIILLFAGHAVELEGEVFLVPLEGELDAKQTLIPLSWLFERMKKCVARQKLLILDTCRLDPGRGLERPGSGPMEEKLDALLAKPPIGIQVWCACVKGQYSYEVDGGSYFLKQLLDTLEPGILKKIQQVEDPLPVEVLAAVVNKRIEKEVASQLKEKQTPRLAGQEGAGEPTFDKSQPLPAKLIIPKPAPPAGGMAKAADVRSILNEVELPPIKLAREETARLQIEDLVPFSAKKLADYAADYISLKEIEDNAQKFPLRIAVLKAVKLIREKFDAKNAAVILRENFSGNTNDKVKAEILKEQARPAELMEELQEAKESLLKVGEERDNESSKRWQAHYDYILAQVLARIAYVEEYSLMLGKIRKDDLPPLEEGQTGFRLASRDRLAGTKEFKDMAADSRKIFKKLAREHKGTPWEILAKREQLTALGLQWQATR